MVHYEDLILDSATAVHRLSGLGVPLDHDAVPRGRSNYQHHMATESAEASVGRWRHDLDRATVELLPDRLAGRMEPFGYDLTHQRPTTPSTRAWSTADPHRRRCVPKADGRCGGSSVHRSASSSGVGCRVPGHRAAGSHRKPRQTASASSRPIVSGDSTPSKSATSSASRSKPSAMTSGGSPV
jgi:hypothetical protein